MMEFLLVIALFMAIGIATANGISKNQALDKVHTLQNKVSLQDITISELRHDIKMQAPTEGTANDEVDIVVRDNRNRRYWVTLNGTDWGSNDGNAWYAFNSTNASASSSLAFKLGTIIKCANLNEELTKAACGVEPEAPKGLNGLNGLVFSPYPMYYGSNMPAVPTGVSVSTHGPVQQTTTTNLSMADHLEAIATTLAINDFALGGDSNGNS